MPESVGEMLERPTIRTRLLDRCDMPLGTAPQRLGEHQSAFAGPQPGASASALIAPAKGRVWPRPMRRAAPDAERSSKTALLRSGESVEQPDEAAEREPRAGLGLCQFAALDIRTVGVDVVSILQPAALDYLTSSHGKIATRPPSEMPIADMGPWLIGSCKIKAFQPRFVERTSHPTFHGRFRLTIGHAFKRRTEGGHHVGVAFQCGQHT